MRKYTIAIVAAPDAAGGAWAQSHTSGGSLEVIGDVAVTQLVAKHIELNEKVRTVPGYRIQIGSLAGNDAKTRAFDKKERFKQAYPEVPIYLIYDEPNFRLKVGDFINKLEA